MLFAHCMALLLTLGAVAELATVFREREPEIHRVLTEPFVFPLACEGRDRALLDVRVDGRSVLTVYAP